MFFYFLEKEFVVYLCGGGIIMNEFKIYSNLSKAFARHQLVEKFCFELQVGKLLFDEELDLFMIVIQHLSLVMKNIGKHMKNQRKY